MRHLTRGHFVGHIVINTVVLGFQRLAVAVAGTVGGFSFLLLVLLDLAAVIALFGLVQEDRDLLLGHLLEGLEDQDIVFELRGGFGAGDERVDVLAPGEAEALLDAGDLAVGDGAHGVGLHGENAKALLAGLGQDIVDEAEVVGIDQVDGHLNGLPLAGGEQSQVDGRIVVPGEANVADLALLFGFDEGFEGAVGGEDLLGLLQFTDLVALPEIEIVGLHAPELFFKQGHGRVA